jgi:hypothetical protein
VNKRLVFVVKLDFTVFQVGVVEKKRRKKKLFMNLAPVVF